jgi:ribosomal protein S6--L-glutamate ligase
MHFAVLASPGSWYLRDLQRAAADQHEITLITYRDLTATLGKSAPRFFSARVDLRSVDAVLVRTMPPGSLEQVVFRMDVLGRLEAAGIAVINSARAIEAAVDKYLASAKLEAAGLATPRTFVCQTVDEAIAGFNELGGDVVMKPLFGAEGRGITRLTDEALAQRAFSLLANLGGVIYLQEFIPHDGMDLRILIVGDRTFGMKRRNKLDWRTNVSRGADVEPLELTADLVDLARRAANAVGASVAGVDLLPGRDGKLYAIEVNAVPGWQAIYRVTGVDIAREVLEFAATRAPMSALAKGPSAALH